jgi:hypothetical protein
VLANVAPIPSALMARHSVVATTTTSAPHYEPLAWGPRSPGTWARRGHASDRSERRQSGMELSLGAAVRCAARLTYATRTTPPATLEMARRVCPCAESVVCEASAPAPSRCEERRSGVATAGIGPGCSAGESVWIAESGARLPGAESARRRHL